MNVQKTNKSALNQKKALLNRMLIMSGVAFLMLGSYFYFNLDTLTDMTGLNQSDAWTVALAMIIVGFGDIISVIVLSRLNEKR